MSTLTGTESDFQGVGDGELRGQVYNVLLGFRSPRAMDTFPPAGSSQALRKGEDSSYVTFNRTPQSRCHLQKCEPRGPGRPVAVWGTYPVTLWLAGEVWQAGHRGLPAMGHCQVLREYRDPGRSPRLEGPRPCRTAKEIGGQEGGKTYKVCTSIKE